MQQVRARVGSLFDCCYYYCHDSHTDITALSLFSSTLLPTPPPPWWWWWQWTEFKSYLTAYGLVKELLIQVRSQVTLFHFTITMVMIVLIDRPLHALSVNIHSVLLSSPPLSSPMVPLIASLPYSRNPLHPSLMSYLLIRLHLCWLLVAICV